MTQETKLGLFVLAAVTALVVSIALLGDFQFQSRYKLNILFNDIAGLPSKAKVKIAGVEVGTVKEITLEENKAKVTVWIKEGIVIRSDAQASIVATGLIGSKYLELTVGKKGSPDLKDGDVITGIDPISIDKVIASVMEQLDGMSQAFKGKEGQGIVQNLDAALANIREVSETLKKTVTQHEQELSDIVENVHAFTKDMAEITAENKEAIKTTIRDISEAVAKLDRIMTKLEKGEGTLGKLMTDEEMGEDLKKSFKEIKETVQETKRVMRRLNLIETSWDYKLRYDTENSVAKSDLGLKISPRPGKYYYIGGSNLGDTNTKDPEDRNTINALVGREWEFAQVYGGVIRSKGGVGGSVKPFYKWNYLSRLEFTAEGYDFGRDVPVAKAKVNLGARVKLANWAYVGAQNEDVYDINNTNVYGNLVIRDDDIAYILGLVGLAKP
ncbi:MAG: MCE family protein [Endomicrobiales bacterium]|nr:MCE family protein [Endomicrobiales bacterium]